MAATKMTPLEHNVRANQPTMPGYLHNSFASDGANHDFLADSRGKGRLTIAIDNLSDRVVTVQVYGAHADSTPGDDPGELGVMPIGSSFTVGAVAKEYETINDPFPFYIFRVSTPAAGDAGVVHLYVDFSAF